MDEYLDELRRAVDAQLHALAVVGALTVPDICGALGYPNGRADGRRYREWWDANMPTGYGEHMPGKRAYAFRNSLLHQGSTAHERRPNDRVILMEPRPDDIVVHLGTHLLGDDEAAHIIYIPYLVQDIVTAARHWLEGHRNDAIVRRNLERFAHRRPDGYPGAIMGTAVIA